MTAAENAALADIRGYAGANRVRVAPHARLRMIDRNVSPADLRTALATALRCRMQTNGRIRVFGVDADGDQLDPVVILEGDVLVVTLLG